MILGTILLKLEFENGEPISVTAVYLKYRKTIAYKTYLSRTENIHSCITELYSKLKWKKDSDKFVLGCINHELYTATNVLSSTVEIT